MSSATVHMTRLGVIDHRETKTTDASRVRPKKRAALLQLETTKRYNLETIDYKPRDYMRTTEK